MTRADVIDRIYAVLGDGKVSVGEVWPYRDLPVYCVEISGDWKHDHARADWLIEDKLGGTLLRKDITEDTGCDWYPAIHYYSIIGEV